LFSRRLARAIDDPKKWLSESWIITKKFFHPIQQPSSSQTKAFIATVLILTGGVLLWDATHQDFPIEGVNPTNAAGSEGWVVGVEDIDDEITIKLWNVSNQKEAIIEGNNWSSPPQIELSNNNLILFDESNLDFFQLNNSSIEVFEPIFSITNNDELDRVSIIENNQGQPCLVIVKNNTMEIINVLHDEVFSYEHIQNLTAIEGSGQLFASAYNTINGPIINVTTPFNPGIEINILIENFSNDLNDEYLENLYDTPVDYNNSTIIDIEMDGSLILVLVDVGPLNRLILVDTLTGNQEMISNPLWPSESPSIEGNYIAFLQRPITSPTINLDPENFNREVFLWNIEDNNGRIQITLDDLDQENPHVLDNGVTWIEIDENGDSELVIYSLEKTFEEYSSVVLQSAILMLIPLLLLLSHQAAIEKRISN
jgi:hypothetical protein